ncbi:MAG: hypothetical protein ABJ205_00250 [Erythrobacter sp.]|uniref:hypothetical protein n=1 Tax=Erythrobacter sp. TaxID=1042 RepID=UPI0032650E9D
MLHYIIERTNDGIPPARPEQNTVNTMGLRNDWKGAAKRTRGTERLIALADPWAKAIRRSISKGLGSGFDQAGVCYLGAKADNQVVLRQSAFSSLRRRYALSSKVLDN